MARHIDASDLTPAQVEYLTDNYTPFDAEEAYRQMLNECLEELPSWFREPRGGKAEVFEDSDPTAYRVGFTDFYDELTQSGDYVEIGDELYTCDDAQEAIDECPEDDDEPQEDDYIMSDTGTLGGQTAVYQYGKLIGIYDTEEEAEQAIRDHIKESKYWPNIYKQDDHGGHAKREL